MFQRAGINLFGKRQSFGVAFRQSDQLLKPGCAGCFDVQSRAEPGERAADRSVTRELVTTRVNAQLQRRGQAVLFYCERDYRQVIAELLLELRNVANVIHPFVKPPGELWSDGLERNGLLREGRQDH